MCAAQRDREERQKGREESMTKDASVFCECKQEEREEWSKIE